MAAKVSVELGAYHSLNGAAVHGKCVASEELAVSSTAATTTLAVTASHVGKGVNIARVVNEDTACYFARGSTPDPTATAETSATTARRLIPAGGVFETMVGVGDKFAVKAV